MKKSELKGIIREMIQEELNKMNKAAALQESAEASTAAPAEEMPVAKVSKAVKVEEAADGSTGVSMVKSNTYLDIASDIYNSDEFRGAFAIDGTVYGDEVNLVIEDALMSSYPTLSDEKFAGAVTAIRKHLSNFVIGKDEVLDADFYSDDAFADLDKIYKDHFDSEGNPY